MSQFFQRDEGSYKRFSELTVTRLISDAGRGMTRSNWPFVRGRYNPSYIHPPWANSHDWDRGIRTILHRYPTIIPLSIHKAIGYWMWIKGHTSCTWSAAPFPMRTGLDPLCPSRCVSSISSKSFPPANVCHDESVSARERGHAPWMVYMIWRLPSGFLLRRRSKINSMYAG